MISEGDRIEGALIGLLVGDALGVPYEFGARRDIPAPAIIELMPPAGFQRAHVGVPPGTWSDDGAQALVLLASLLDRGKFDADDFGRKLVAWDDEGYMAVDGVVFDVGVQTGQAIRALRSGVPALQAGSTDERSNGNGSLMRVLPLALWHRGTDEELAADAQAQSRVTHAHLRSQICCALYCLWVRRVLAGATAAWDNALETLRQIYAYDPPAHAELDYHIRPLEEVQARGSGYVVDCLRSALWASNQGGYETAVRAAVSLGNDTDTTACVTGGITGARDGTGAIPRRWRDGLRGRELVAPLLLRLLPS